VLSGLQLARLSNRFHSEDHMKHIAAAFVKAQQAFAPALKTNTNPHFKSRYVGLDGCIEAVIDALNSNGIALLQPTHQDDTGVTVETVLMHESGEYITSGPLFVPAAKQDPQGYGSALTYARRYSLMTACGIAPEDDDGNAASKTKPQATASPAQPEKPKATPEQSAAHIEKAVGQGKAADMAIRLSELQKHDLDAVWELLKPETQDAIVAVWPA
jgi:hypothetical protein